MRYYSGESEKAAERKAEAPPTKPGATEEGIRPPKGELSGFMGEVDEGRRGRSERGRVSDSGQRREGDLQQEDEGKEVAPGPQEGDVDEQREQAEEIGRDMHPIFMPSIWNGSSNTQSTLT